MRSVSGSRDLSVKLILWFYTVVHSIKTQTDVNIEGQTEQKGKFQGHKCVDLQQALNNISISQRSTCTST